MRLTFLIPKIYAAVLRGSLDKQKASAHSLLKQGMLNMAIVFEFVS